MMASDLPGGFDSADFMFGGWAEVEGDVGGERERFRGGVEGNTEAIGEAASDRVMDIEDDVEAAEA
jgi:hypothetical protein